MKKVLVVQFRKKPQYIADEQRVFLRAIDDLSVELCFKNAVLESLNWNQPERILEDAAGVIFGGSGELDFDGGRVVSDEVVQESHELAKNMSPFFDFLALRRVPTLGICYGHQVLGHLRGVPITNDASQAKAGTHTVTLTKEGREDPLFQNIPDQFGAQYGHKDSLSTLPDGATLLACGEQCSFSALKFNDNHYTVQFHPELMAEDLLERFVRHPEFLPPGKTPDMLVSETPDASQVLRNFLEHIVR